ncbi:MAG: imidazole glycerol phosphate synthase subunit HisF [Planctomycetaceae bacterium]
MLKVRVMPTLLYNGATLVKGVGFDSWRTVGSALQAIKVYALRQVDELIFLDITRTREGRPPDFELVDDLANECFMPLTVGGGVRSLEDVRRLLQVGADKVALNTAAVEVPGLVEEIAARFGSQCCVVSIDARRTDAGYEVFTRCGRRATGLEPAELARRVEERGAGEVLVGSIERDGTLGGYDLELLRRVSRAVTIPVIASGGAGSGEDMARAVLEGGASAVAAASLFHFTHSTPLEVKRGMRDRGIPVRLQEVQA